MIGRLVASYWHNGRVLIEQIMFRPRCTAGTVSAAERLTRPPDTRPVMSKMT